MVHGSLQFSNQTKCLCNVIFNLKTSSYLKISQRNPTPKVLYSSTWINYITSAILLLKGCNTALNISTDLKASITRVVAMAPEATASFILTNKWIIRFVVKNHTYKKTCYQMMQPSLRKTVSYIYMHQDLNIMEDH